MLRMKIELLGSLPICMSWRAVSLSAQDVNRTVRESSYMYELVGCLT